MKRVFLFWFYCLLIIMFNFVENEVVEIEYFVLVKMILCGVIYEIYCVFFSSWKKGS